VAPRQQELGGFLTSLRQAINRTLPTALQTTLTSPAFNSKSAALPRTLSMRITGRLWRSVSGTFGVERIRAVRTTQLHGHVWAVRFGNVRIVPPWLVAKCEPPRQSHTGDILCAAIPVAQLNATGVVAAFSTRDHALMYSCIRTHDMAAGIGLLPGVWLLSKLTQNYENDVRKRNTLTHNSVSATQTALNCYGCARRLRRIVEQGLAIADYAPPATLGQTSAASATVC
jgi:hypothetical protein